MAHEFGNGNAECRGLFLDQSVLLFIQADLCANHVITERFDDITLSQPTFQTRHSLRARTGISCSRRSDVKPAKLHYTEKQGQYLPFIRRYIKTRGYSPAESDIQMHFRSEERRVGTEC